jgi:RNA polymerase sigma-70 factor, ECF subfamily
MTETLHPKTSQQSPSDCVFVAQAVLRVRPVVRAVVRRVLGANDPEYEDILQSSLERVLQTFEQGMFRNGSMSQWAAVVARNVAVDALRARTRERRVLSRDPDAAGANCQAVVDPERLAGARELLAQFASALSRLRAGSAQVVYLHDAFGYELSEIAVTLGISVAAAQSRLVRGRRQIVHSRSRGAGGSSAQEAFAHTR